MPAFSLTPLSAQCPCFKTAPKKAKSAPAATPSAPKAKPDAGFDELDVLLSFDDLVAEFQHLRLEDLDGEALSSLFLRVSAEIGSAQTAYLEGAYKQSLSFMLRASAMLRHIASSDAVFATLVTKYAGEDEEP